jgi:CDP-diacylglycerol--glycerol-3-phosphate 3-phosphatidyltransferase
MLDNQNSRAFAAKFVDPIAKGLLKIGLTANQVTVIGACASSLIALMTISKGDFSTALLFLIPLVAADLLDGTMARLSNSVSKAGAFLDSVMDRLTDLSLLIAFTLWAIENMEFHTAQLGFGAIAVSALIPYIRAKSESMGIACNVGILERGERVLILGIATIASAFGYTISIRYALAAIVVFGSITVIQRIIHVLKSVN